MGPRLVWVQGANREGEQLVALHGTGCGTWGEGDRAGEGGDGETGFGLFNAILYEPVHETGARPHLEKLTDQELAQMRTLTKRISC